MKDCENFLQPAWQNTIFRYDCQVTECTGKKRKISVDNHAKLWYTITVKERRASPSSPHADGKGVQITGSVWYGTVSDGVFRPFFIFLCNRLEVLNN